MTTDPQHERRWLILAGLGLAQLMVILDVTVVNIALPSAQHALGFSDGDAEHRASTLRLVPQHSA